MTEIVANLLAATVRVDDASSGAIVAAPTGRFVLTAGHVVKGRPQLDVRSKKVIYTADVLKNGWTPNREADVALLTDHPRLDCAGLRLSDDLCEPGDRVLVSGYPSGWREATGALSTGIVAGHTGDSIWITAAANWGSSGGPVVRASDGLVIGLIIGDRSETHRDLHELQRVLKEHRDRANDRQSPQITAGGVSVTSGILTIALTVAKQVSTHFRSGFVEVVPAHVIRHQLAW